MKCFECGKGRLKPAVADVTTTFRNENISVKTQVEVCNRCGFQIVRGQDMGKFSLLVADEYRRKHGLLTSAEIRGRRERLRMSQEAFARYLGVGIASVKRWELGLVQDKAMNELMVLKTDPVRAAQNAKALSRRLSRVRAAA
jgi:putative zinc finger/helix-turn-helix YgiT family protein